MKLNSVKINSSKKDDNIFVGRIDEIKETSLNAMIASINGFEEKVRNLKYMINDNNRRYLIRN